MTRTTVEITTDLRDDLKLMKGILAQPNYTDTIRRIMFYAGYNDAFLKKKRGIPNRAPMRMQGDSPD